MPAESTSIVLSRKSMASLWRVYSISNKTMKTSLRQGRQLVLIRNNTTESYLQNSCSSTPECTQIVLSINSKASLRNVNSAMKNPRKEGEQLVWIVFFQEDKWCKNSRFPVGLNVRQPSYQENLKRDHFRMCSILNRALIYRWDIHVEP